MKKFALIALVISALVGCEAEPQKPETLVEGYAFCIDRDSWVKMNDAVVANDAKMIDFLESSNLCGVLKGGLHYSVIDRYFDGTANVRVWVGDEYFDIYTNNEATR